MELHGSRSLDVPLTYFNLFKSNNNFDLRCINIPDVAFHITAHYLLKTSSFRGCVIAVLLIQEIFHFFPHRPRSLQLPATEGFLEEFYSPKHNSLMIFIP